MVINIVVIGAGNVATHLATQLYNKGFHIVQVYSRQLSNAQALADAVDSSFTDNIHDIVTDADMYVYSVKDSVLPALIEQINVPDAIHIHTAGSVSATVFSAKYSNYGVIYPLQTLSKSKAVDFGTVPLLIEASNETTRTELSAIAATLVAQYSFASSEQRAQLHLAAVFCCNFVNYMYSVSADILNNAQLSFDFLRPLIQETADKIKFLSPIQAQTGPAVRYDRNIIDKHIQMLHDQPELADLYEKLSQLIHSRHSEDHSESPSC